MTVGDSDLRIRPGRIRSTRAPKPKSFINQVLRAAKKAGHTSGQAAAGRRSAAYGRSTFGRGRLAFSRSRLFSPTRRVVVKARVVRHKGRAFRSAPLTAHLSYLKRDGVTRSGETGRDVRCGQRPCRWRGLRRTVQGRPASFQVHRLARGCRRHDRPEGLHPRSRQADGDRSRHAARLGGRRSLEHRQPSRPSSRSGSR